MLGTEYCCRHPAYPVALGRYEISGAHTGFSGSIVQSKWIHIFRQHFNLSPGSAWCEMEFVFHTRASFKERWFKVRSPTLLLFSSSVIFLFLKIFKGRAHTVLAKALQPKAWHSRGDPRAGRECVDPSEVQSPGKDCTSCYFQLCPLTQTGLQGTSMSVASQ